MSTIASPTETISPEELQASLQRVLERLPQDLQAALDIDEMRKRAAFHVTKRATRKKGADKKGPPKSGAAKKTLTARSNQAAFAAYSGNRSVQIANAMIHEVILKLNELIPVIFTTLPISAFGDDDNRLDPLNFHAALSTERSGEACVPQRCLTMPSGIPDICVPPFRICAGGQASAGLSELRGLSTARVAKLILWQLPPPPDGARIMAAPGRWRLTTDGLTATGFARASGGPAGLNIPVGSSCSATINGVEVRSAINFLIDLRGPKFLSIKLSLTRVHYQSIDINISGLGPFNHLIGPLVERLKSIVERFLDINGKLSHAIEQLLQKQLNRFVG